MGSIEYSSHQEDTSEMFSKETKALLALALPDAYTRLSKESGPQARERIKNGLINELGPYLEEISIIAEERESKEYQASGKAITTYTNVESAVVLCSDRRIAASAVAAPQAATMHRRPGGVPELRPSTSHPDKNQYTLNDHVASASIGYRAERQKDAGKSPKFYEKIVIHVDCAAGKKTALAKALEENRPTPTGDELEMESIEGAFVSVRDQMSGFNTDIQRVGGEGLILISLFDIHAQGETYGLEQVFDEKRDRGGKLFDRSKSLHQNFEDMEKNGEIIRTATLDKKLLQDNPELARMKQFIQAGVMEPLDLVDPNKHAETMIGIAQTTEGITRMYEASQNGFAFIPKAMQRNITDPDFLRTVAFDMIRNSVRRIRSGIIPGEHDRLKHPERSTRIGSTGGALNEQNPAFIISTPGGELRPQDKEAAKIIIPLQAHVAEELGIDLEKQARVVIVAEEYDATDYNPAKPELARKAYYEKAALVKYNAAEIRNLFPKEVAHGKIVVVAALHDRTRRMTHVVTSLPQENGTKND